MATILQRVLQTITPYTTWAKETPTNERKGQASPTTEKTSNPPIAAPSYRDDIKSFGEQMMKHIQSGALTQDILDRALQERANRVANNIELKKQETIAEIDREIEAVYQSLPDSQRQRFTENVDRQTRIDAKLDTTWSDLFKTDNSERFSWQTDLIAKLVQDPELEQLAESIRIKENSTYESVYAAPMTAYSDHPLSGAFIALRVQQAGPSPEKLQAFIAQALNNKRAQIVLPMEDWIGVSISDWSKLPATPSQEDAHVFAALEQTGYDSKNRSILISNAFLDAALPIPYLGYFKSYAAQLSNEDSEKIKKHYVQQFAQHEVVGHTQPINRQAFRQIEMFLSDPMFSKTFKSASHDLPPLDHTPGWLGGPQVGTGRLADVLLQAYDIDTVVPILEAYQGNRALDGSLSSTELISDVRAYLNERTARTPTTPEVKSDLQLS